jgi:hypothetical protein
MKEEIGLEVMDGIHVPQVVGSCEHSNDHSGSIKWDEFLDNLSDDHFLKKNHCSMQSVTLKVLSAKIAF